jgi:4-hydroxyphenylpyruvate dioxygenase
VSVKLHGVDSVEFAVKSIADSEAPLKLWGFSKLGEGIKGSTKHHLWAQGKIKILLSQGNDEKSAAYTFVKKHGDGISNINFLVDDAGKTLEAVAKKGARINRETKKESLKKGDYKHGSINVMGDVIHTFVSRHGGSSFSPWVETEIESFPEGHGLFAVDHLTANLPTGELDKWADFYSKVFGFKETRFFTISTGRTGLISKVMENEEGTVKIPMNEPTDKKSQIQEYIDVNKGAGIQHLALLTADILKTLPTLRKAGQKFLDVPDTYYDDVPKRVKNIKEDLNHLKQHRILADGDNKGYILQIFSENVVGPFFYEVIQRCGHTGFGEGNFKALFQAIERDQERRGVL